MQIPRSQTLPHEEIKTCLFRTPASASLRREIRDKVMLLTQSSDWDWHRLIHAHPSSREGGRGVEVMGLRDCGNPIPIPLPSAGIQV